MNLTNPSAFFDKMRSGLLGPTLSPDEVSGCNAILEAGEGLPVAQVAYMLATAYHETASTMQPINEYGGDAYFFRRYDKDGWNPNIASRLGNTHAGDGVKFHGRGYVQLTGRANYAKAERELGVPLLSDPGLALQPPIAAKIMRRGMTEGWFTGKRLSDFDLPGSYLSARRIINGTDRAVDIANYAVSFEAALRAGGWR